MLVQIAQVSKPDDLGLQYIVYRWDCKDPKSFEAGLNFASKHVKTTHQARAYNNLLTTIIVLQPYVEEGSNLLTMTPSDMETECRRQKITHIRLCELVGAQFAAGALAFPFKKTFMGSVDNAFRALCQFQFSESSESSPKQPINVKFRSNRFPFTFKGRAVTIHGGGYAMDWIGDYFSEPQRLAARRKDMSASPLDFWRCPGFVAKEVLFDLPAWTPETMRERFFAVMPECTQFKPSIARAIYMKFNATRVLDFSAGWGDRLIGALSLPEQVQRYVAFDPNTSLRDSHNAMIDRFAPIGRHGRYCIFYEPFESHSPSLLAYETFDLVFTSPPYFDFETYTDEPGQSIISHPTFEMWIKKFLFVSLTCAWAKLDVGGHMVIHIGDVGRNKICERMCAHVVDTLHGVYCGLLGVAGTVSECPRPTWVFSKRR